MQGLVCSRIDSYNTCLSVAVTYVYFVHLVCCPFLPHTTALHTVLTYLQPVYWGVWRYKWIHSPMGFCSVTCDVRLYTMQSLCQHMARPHQTHVPPQCSHRSEHSYLCARDLGQEHNAYWHLGLHCRAGQCRHHNQLFPPGSPVQGFGMVSTAPTQEGEPALRGYPSAVHPFFTLLAAHGHSHKVWRLQHRF